MSRAGREVLIKSVLQAILSYVMSIFLIPESLGDDIQKLMNSFWWGSGGNSSKGIHWLSWDSLSMHKSDGGKGFRNLYAFNLAMLDKQGWRIMSNPDALVSQILKAKYSPQGEFLNSKLGGNPSYTWRSIWKSRKLLMEGSRWLIGSGENVKVLAR